MLMNQVAASDARRTAECAVVLEEMLCELEVWDSENSWRRHQRAIRDKEVGTFCDSKLTHATCSFGNYFLTPMRILAKRIPLKHPARLM